MTNYEAELAVAYAAQETMEEMDENVLVVLGRAREFAERFLRNLERRGAEVGIRRTEDAASVVSPPGEPEW